MDNQSNINDEFFIDSYELFDDFGIDYEYFREILNSETGENNSAETNFDLDLDPQLSAAALDNFDISELDLKLEPQLNNQNGGWVKRKRLRKGTEEYNRRKEKIKLQNRMSARKSLEKKEDYIRGLEAKVRKLEAESKFRKRVMQIFPNAKPAGRLCGLRRAFSTSDFYLNTEVADEKGVDMYL